MLTHPFLCFFSFVNPQCENFEWSKSCFPCLHAVIPETSPPGCRTASREPSHGHHPAAALVPRPDGPHLLPGAHLSARVSQSRPTCKVRHPPGEEPPAHTFTVRFQTHDGATKSQPQGRKEDQCNAVKMSPNFLRSLQTSSFPLT